MGDRGDWLRLEKKTLFGTKTAMHGPCQVLKSACLRDLRCLCQPLRYWRCKLIRQA